MLGIQLVLAVTTVCITVIFSGLRSLRRRTAELEKAMNNHRDALAAAGDFMLAQIAKNDNQDEINDLVAATFLKLYPTKVPDLLTLKRTTKETDA